MGSQSDHIHDFVRHADSSRVHRWYDVEPHGCGLRRPKHYPALASELSEVAGAQKLFAGADQRLKSDPKQQTYVSR